MRKAYKIPVLVALLLAAAPLIHAQTLPAGTAISVTLDQAVSSKDAHVGDQVHGVLARSVVVNGNVVIAKGAEAHLSVASAQASGRLSTPAKLYLRLDSVVVNGRAYTMSAHWAGSTGNSHGKRNAVAIGGTAAVGALIGGLAGGGKGAAIGAGAGAGAGTVGAAATGKKDITYSAEDKLSFTLKAPVTIK
ncbi:MAG: hypothetical protein ACRD4K_14795 [Candidatus Acidiferrales bacterium]